MLINKQKQKTYSDKNSFKRDHNLIPAIKCVYKIIKTSFRIKV